MQNRMKFYIDGAWVDPAVAKTVPVVNPATEEKMYDVAVGSKADVDKAVAAARKAFETFSVTARSSRPTRPAPRTSPPPSPTRWARRCRWPSAHRRAPVSAT
jgi:Aldehyde dehydrogenase family